MIKQSALQSETFPKQISLSAEFPEPSSKTSHDICIERVTTQSQMEEVYKLHHDSYVALGYHEPTDDGMLRYYEKFDWSEDTAVFVATFHGAIVGTISCSIVSGKQELPMDKTFLGDAYDLVRETGGFSAIWRLITCPEVRNNLKIVTKLIDTVIAHSLANGVSTIACTIHKKHSRFYQRIFKMTEVASYEGLSDLSNVSACMLRWDAERCPKRCRASS